MQLLKKMIEKAGKTDINVSITGETGTGKEVVAKSIHYSSNRDGKFVPINVAAIPENLLESELFGYEKGAFTGANSRKIGKFEEAQGGTIFLDEIAEMPLPMQAKLLRVLQERELVRLGGNKPIKLDVRIICATHKNLADEAAKGTFRQDLHFRLIGLPISIAPLRERKTDIKLLSNHFIEHFCEANGMEMKRLSSAALDKLKGYDFPGNIRELKALVDLAIVLAEGDEIEATDIQLHVSGQSLEGLLGTEKSLKEYTAQIVQHFVDKYDKNVVKAAEALQIGKSTIYRMIANKEVEA
jgi:DNA-binding NtrC family response regulator